MPAFRVAAPPMGLSRGLSRDMPRDMPRDMELDGVRLNPRLLIPLGLAATIVLLWATGLTDHLSWAGLAREQAALKLWVAAHPALAPCLFVLLYFASAALSLPQGVLLTMTGGLLFGPLLGGALAVTGATTGAVTLFLIARSAFGDGMARKGGAVLGKLREELRRNGFFYLLTLRLLPVVPFWVINLAAPLAGVRLVHFAVATLFGIMPATFIMASVGSGLSGVLARGERPSAGVIVSWPVLGPLLGLAALSLAPVLWRKWRGSGNTAE